MAIFVDQTKCTGCGDCVPVCAVQALTVENDVVHLAADECIDCGACVDECSTGALSFDEKPAAARPLASQDFVWLPRGARRLRW
jgi:ferredoxin